MKEIEDIIRFHDGLDWDTERMALGTVVHVEESSYRRVGARLYVTGRGYWVGGISGGCLEGDALKKAQLCINSEKSSIVVYDTQDDDAHQIGVGLGCEGRIEVLFTPINPHLNNNPIELLRKLIHKRSPSILIHVLRSRGKLINVEGKIYTEKNIELLSEERGVNQQQVQEIYKDVRDSNKSILTTIQSSESKINYDLLVEHISPNIRVVCVGSNYDLISVLQIVNSFSWEAIVIGDNRKFSKEVHEKSLRAYSKEQIDEVKIDDYTAVVLMAHDYETDKRMLDYFIKKQPIYLGLLGPRKRMLRMQNELKIDVSSLPFLFAPAGLDIGATTPLEIAVAITSEIIAVFRQREGGFLKNRTSPIHDRPRDRT